MPTGRCLTTVMPGGHPQTSERNLRRDPRVTILCYDPHRPLRYLEIRGRVVEMFQDDGARRHLDEISSRYLGRPVRYFGDVIPARFAESEVPVLCRILPLHVVAVDAEPAGSR